MQQYANTPGSGAGLSPCADNRMAEPSKIELRGGALEMWESEAREILIEGPAGTGKSLGCAWKVHGRAVEFPGSRHLIVRRYREWMSETILSLFDEDVMGRDSIQFLNPDLQRQNRSVYNYVNGSIVVVMGLNDPQAVMSGEYETIYVCEGCDIESESMYAKLASRVGRNKLKAKCPYPQVIVDCNPREPEHWLNQRPNRRKSSGEPQMHRILSRHEDNPAVDEDYLDSLRSLPPLERARLYEGRWVGAGGQMFFGDGLIDILRQRARMIMALREPVRTGLVVAA